MKNYATLNVPCEIKRDSFDPRLVPLDDRQHWPFSVLNPPECLTDQALDFFGGVFGTDVMCQLHKGKPNQVMPIHIDGRVYPDGILRCPRDWAVNIHWGSTSSEMFWYELNDTAKNKLPKSSNSNNLHPGYSPMWEDTDVIEIDRHVLVGPTLINICIPHHVKNYDTLNTRWALTIRAADSKLTYEQAYQLFKPYML